MSAKSLLPKVTKPSWCSSLAEDPTLLGSHSRYAPITASSSNELRKESVTADRKLQGTGRWTYRCLSSPSRAPLLQLELKLMLKACICLRPRP